jgi:uncharacterized protein YkwD
VREILARAANFVHYSPVRSPSAAIAGLLLGVALAAGTAASARGGPPEAVVAQPVLEARVIGEVNRLRASHGLVQLRPSRKLVAAAAEHSQEMVTAGYFSHDGIHRSYGRRLAAFYPARGHRRWMVGENLVWGSPTIGAREAVQLWMDSPEHKANLLRRGWRELGISALYAREAPGVFQGLEVTVITLDFGRRR